MRRNSPSDFDNEPHTLRSNLPSHGIPICKPSHPSSLSLASNLLEISQSPTRGFVTQEQMSQSTISGIKACSMNANLQKEKLHSESFPFDKADLSDTTNKTRSVSNTFAGRKSPRMEILDSMGKSNEKSTVFPCPSGNPSAGLSHEPSVGISFPDNSTPLSNIAFSAPELVAQFTTTPSSDMSSLKFFSFVILHVPEDQEEAMRVCGIMRNLDIGEGTTFCEGFEVAGLSPLKCLEDAVENSAYIVLLLTSGFLSKWGEFQTNIVLMNSIEDANKSGTIIPFIPKFKTPGSKLPLALTSLIPLNENSCLFKTQVQNTFKQNMIKRQQERWKKNQDLKAFTKRVQDAKELANDLEMQQHIAMEYQAHLCAISSLLSIRPQPIFTGQGSVIHINNASNVQIGNQNSMNVQQSTNVSQTELSGECYQECNKKFQS